MSHDLISDSIFHLNNDNAAFQAHMTDTFRGSLGSILEALSKYICKGECIRTWSFLKLFISLESFLGTFLQFRFRCSVRSRFPGSWLSAVCFP